MGKYFLIKIDYYGTMSDKKIKSYVNKLDAWYNVVSIRRKSRE